MYLAGMEHVTMTNEQPKIRCAAIVTVMADLVKC